MAQVIITDHARFEAERRGIALELVLFIAQQPKQKVSVKMGRFVLQNKGYDNNTEKEKLIRVIAEETGDTLKAISVYKTSKIGKYRTEEEA